MDDDRSGGSGICRGSRDVTGDRRPDITPYEGYVQEEGEYEWEYAAYKHSGKDGKEEARTEPALLVQPLGEPTASLEPLEHGQAEQDGHYRDVSGDGCGDGGYCGGHWVKKSGKGHYRGEPIGGSPWEPVDGFCISVGWTNPITGYVCGAYGVVREATRK